MRISDLRVGLLAPRFAPFRGGLETYVASAAAALAAAGAEVTVVTQSPRGAAIPSHEINDGYTVERHRLPVAGTFDIPSLSAARAVCRPGRFDVIWVHSYHTPLAWLAAEQATAPVMFTPHYHGTGHSSFRRALHRAYRPAGRRLVAKSNRIVVDTDAEADLVLRHFPEETRPDKITVVPPVVADPTRGLAPYPGGSDIVLTVARQETYKRTDLLVQAVSILRDRAVAVRLVVVGDGSALAASRQFAAQVGAEDVVTFTGAVDDETLGRWWASASVYATASEQEAYGIGLGEALLAGLPVVASAIPAHREVVRRAGPAAAARLCPVTESDSAAASEYAGAIAAMLAAGGTRAARSARCTLPRADEVAEQLIEALFAVSDRARL